MQSTTIQRSYYNNNQSDSDDYSDVDDRISQTNNELESQQNTYNINHMNEKSMKKRERRSKDDNYDRNYICGCGKSYLSYAALYTHAKTKHEGVFPEGTTTLHKKKQGRPKKDEWCAMRINSEYQKIYDFNKDFVHYLEMIPGAKEEKEENNRNFIECFPCDMFTSQKYYEKIFLNMEQIRKELMDSYGNNFLTQLDIIIFEISNIRRLNCNEIFALFLIFIFRFVTKSFYRELVFFVIGYRLLMNEWGWKKCAELDYGGSIDTDQEFCEAQGTEFVPDFANMFIMDYFTPLVQSNSVLKDPSQLEFMGLESIKLLRVILLIKHFCNWLNINKFSSAKIDIFKD